MNLKLACMAAAITAVGLGGGAAHAQQAEGVAAVVNDEVISTFDVRQRAALILASSGIQPSQEALEQVRVQALRSLVDEHLQLQEAREFDITVDPSELDNALRNVARQNNTSVEVMQQQLAQMGAGIGTLRKQLEADIAWQRLINGRYASRVRISNVQIEETIARVTANIAKPQYLVSEIVLPVDSEEEAAQAEEAARRLLEEMAKGAAFPMVARQFSGAPSAAAGGDLGWIAGGELRPELQAAVDGLSPGQVSPPIRSQGAVYILGLRDKREGVDPRAAARVTLTQITAPAGARAALDRARQRIQGCNTIDAAIQGLQGAQTVPLGEVAEAELADDARAQISQTDVGRASAVYEAAGGVAAMVVCARDTSGAGVPSRDEVENRLYQQELAMLSQRYLRNLRRDSTIITR